MKDKILKLLGQGKNQKTICQMLNLTYGEYKKGLAGQLESKSVKPKTKTKKKVSVKDFEKTDKEAEESIKKLTEALTSTFSKDETTNPENTMNIDPPPVGPPDEY